MVGPDDLIVVSKRFNQIHRSFFLYTFFHCLFLLFSRRGYNRSRYPLDYNGRQNKSIFRVTLAASRSRSRASPGKGGR